MFEGHVLTPELAGNNRREQRKHSISDPLAERPEFFDLASVVLCRLFDRPSGGTRNHMHVLVILPPTMCVAEAARVMKCNTSRWLREEVKEFDWQEGYGAFSVSPSHSGAVVDYIKNQAVHHRKRSFEEEFATMLKRCGVDYDPTRT